MGRFDPREGENYGECVTCGMELATDDEARAHRTATMEPGRSSHSTRGKNPPREDQIQSHVDSVIESAIEEALYELSGDVDAGDATADEIKEALMWHSEFADEWEGTR